MHSRSGQERAALLLAAAAVAFLLVVGHRLIVVSDPAAWFHFGRHFPERFGSAPLAYGFPLLVYLAIEALGPLRAFLVNIPVVLALCLLVERFARRQLPAAESAALGPLTGACALFLLVWLDWGLLLQLSNPYRDALAHVSMLAACLLAIDYRESGGRARGRLAAAALCLAYAVSCREATVLVLLPLASYALAARLRPPRVPLAPALLWFGALFTLGCVPLLVQNTLVSGRPWVPAQAAETFAARGTLTPGVAVRFAAGTLPAALSYLWQHLGPGVLALAGVGVAAALRLRSEVVAWLSLPALLVFGLFYASYVRLVERYFFVVDLFLLPVAGLGAAVLIRAALRLLPRVRWLAPAAATLVLAATAASAVLRAFDPTPGIRLGQVRQLCAAVERAAPGDSRVLSEGKLGRFFELFLEREVSVLPWPRRGETVSDTRTERFLSELSARPPVYLVSDSPRAQSVLRREFDLERVADFGGTRLLVSSNRRNQPITVHRLRDWSQRRAQVALEAPAGGDLLLELDVGRHSRRGALPLTIAANGAVLDRAPRDGPNFYALRGGGRVSVELSSPHGVPARPTARLQPLTEPLRLDFTPALPHAGRFDPGFTVGAGGAPTLVESGRVEVPTPGPPVARQLGFRVEPRGEPGASRRLSVRAGGEVLLRRRLEVAAGAGEQTVRLEIELPAAVGSRPGRDLDWRLDQPAGTGDFALALLELEVLRAAPAAPPAE